jgi:hypothetical protein
MYNVARYTLLIPFVVSVSLLAAVPVRAQAPAGLQDEIQVVARISKQFIEDVAAREEIVASIPFDASVLGFRCQGVINGRGKLSVEMTTAQGEATFVVNSKGTGETYARGVHWPIVAMGPASGPFASRTLVRFDGRKFSVVQTTPWAEVHGELDRVEGTHGGPVGRAVGRVALPFGRLLVPRADAEAKPIGEYYLQNCVDVLAEQIVTKLDQTTTVA